MAEMRTKMLLTMMRVQQSTSSLATATLKWTSPIQHVLAVKKRGGSAADSGFEALLRHLLAAKPLVNVYIHKVEHSE